MRSKSFVFGSVLLVVFANHLSVSHAASCIPGFDYAIFAKDSLHIQGNGGTDSFDSSAGTYAATNSCADGAIGTNGPGIEVIDLQGASTKICGDAMVGFGNNPVTGIDEGTAIITGTQGALSAALAMPNVTLPTPAPPNAAPFSISKTNQNWSLAPNFTYGDITCKNGSLTLSAGNYVVNNLSLQSNCQLKLASTPVAFYFKQTLDMTAGVMSNNTGVPANLMFYGSSTATAVHVQGGAGAYFAVYAPTAACDIQGNADIWGAMVCKTADVQGNAHIHFDRALRTLNGGGFSCAATATEISRASPIVATISNQEAVVQGSWDTPSIAKKQILVLADVASFTFPYITGHMRARTSASITTTASTFASGTVLFDAGATGKIPTPNYASCTSFNGTCRHLFTTVAANTTGLKRYASSDILAWNDGNASTIGAQIASTTAVPGIGASQWQTIERTVLAGKLGGVDRSTVAVIGPSTFAGVSTRPKIAYFGGMDGILHAVCASTGGVTPSQNNICPSLGTEIWGFVPRVQLPLIRTNVARVDGSPHVLDVFGDFNVPATGVRSWHTVLIFQTGFVSTSKAATYALDITDPANPTVMWEYTTPSSPGAVDYGTGMTIGTGQAIIAGAPTTLAFLQTNNGGSGGAGVVLTALNVATGAKVWQFTFAYPSPPRSVGADLPFPTTGIPGGAAAVDLTGAGFVTDVVFGDLYGDIWRLNAADGTSRNGTNTPLFRFTTNKHPIGVVPTIYSVGGQQYAIVTSGGFVDPAAIAWSSTSQYAIGVKLKATVTPVVETASKCASCDLAISTALTVGDRGFAQAIVVGTQLFLTSDSTDVNLATFGTTGNTGHLTTVNLVDQTVGAPVSIIAGAASVAHAGTTLFTSSAQKQQQSATAITTTVGAVTEILGSQSFRRQLWLQTF